MALAAYQAQADKPFDHEARMKDLLVRQSQLNAALDLDKNETQIGPERLFLWSECILRRTHSVTL